MDWEDWRVLIFFGFAGLWIAWCVIDYFFIYPFPIFLGVVVLGLVVWVGVVGWKKC